MQKNFLGISVIVTAIIILLSAAALAADFDGDSRDDVAVFRPATGLWSVKDLTRVYYGQSTDEPRPGDFTGDGIADIAIFRPATGLWAVKDITRVYYGASSDIPLQGGGGQRLYDYVVKPGDAADLVAALESDTLNSVFIPAGTYNVSEVIEVDNVRHIIGESNTATIAFSGEDYYLSIDQANCHLEGFRVTGGGDTSPPRGNIYINANYVTVENCRSIDSLSTGFNYPNGVTFPSFINCVARNSATSGFQGWSTTGSSRLTNCAAYNCGYAGFSACQNLSSCYVDGNNTTSMGFIGCRNISASRVDNAVTNGFSLSSRISACTVDGEGNTTNGFISCANLSSCHVMDLVGGGTEYNSCSEDDPDSCD